MSDNLTELIKNYKTPNRAKELLDKTKAVFLVGISGAGKDTILKELLRTEKFHYIVSHTTRLPRENEGVPEQDGIDYHFISHEKAEEMLKNEEFVEAKYYSGNIYGTSIKEFEDALSEQKTAFTDIEVQGVSEYVKASKNVMPIFILPPDFETWQSRLMTRYVGKEPDQADIQKRMETARKELEEALTRDYFEFVVNDDLARAVAAVDEIAHGSLSPSKNQQARQIAQNLLVKLNP
jgi:guanylate kinase